MAAKSKKSSSRGISLSFSTAKGLQASGLIETPIM